MKLLISEISASPFGKTKRTKWSEEERNAIMECFGNLEELPKLPSLNECKQLRDRHPVLNKRTPQMIKTWIDNQRRVRTRHLIYAQSKSH